MKNFRSVAGRLLPVILLLGLPLSAQSGVAGLDGSWDAVVVVGQAEIPFRFEISARGAEPQGFFFEGENRIGSTSGEFADGKLQLDYEFLNSTLTATFDGEKFSVPYPVLYGGEIHDVKDKLPQIANFGAYPTTIFLNRDGRVATVHAGFASAATGEAHTALEYDVEQLVVRLLSEKGKEQASR